MVFTRGCLQTNVSQALSGIVRFFGHGGKPAVGIVRLDQVQAQTAQVLGKFTVVTHQPNHQSVTGRDTSVDYRVLKILILALDLGEGKIEFRVFLGLWIDLARPNGEFVKLVTFFGLSDEASS